MSFLPSAITLPALAQQPTDDPLTVQARSRFKEGVDFYDKGQYENARLAFLQAYALKKHPSVLLNLAQSSAKSGHNLEAAQYFKQFLKEGITASNQQQKADAEAGLAEVRQKLGHIDITAPANATITIDDRDSVTAPVPDGVDVEPGLHTLKSGTETLKLEPKAGQKLTAKFGAGTPATVPPVVPPTTPEEENPPPPKKPPPPPPEDQPVKHTSLLTPPSTMAPVYFGLVVGGLGAIGAIVFGLIKSDAQDKADGVASQIRKAATDRGLSAQGVCNSSDASVKKDFSQACATLKDNNDKVDADATVANISLIVMGVGFVTAAGWYLFGPKREENPNAKNVRFTPYGTLNGGGFSLSGTF